MIKLKLAAIAFATAIITGIGYGQTLINLGTQGKNVDFGNATSTRPVATGTALPGPCLVGDLFFLTSNPPGANLYGCAATNIWALEGAAGTGTASGLNDPGSNGLVVRTAPNTTTAIAVPAGSVVGISDTQTLTNKSIDASEINTGILLGARIPAFSGDFSTSPGSTVSTLITANGSPGTFGDATHVPQIIVDAKGRVTSVTPVAISGGGISALTGDVTASGSGSVAATLAASGVAAGTYGDAAHVPQVTFDAKGRATGVSSVAITSGASAWGAITGTLSSQTDLQAALNAKMMNPMTTFGDIIVGGTLGSPNRLGAGANGSVLTLTNGFATWAAPSGGAGGIMVLTGDGTTPAGGGSQVLTLATVNGSPGACGDATHVCQVTTNGKGLVTSQTPVVMSGGSGSGITQLTGDVTTSSGSGSQPSTLATVNSSPGACGDATHVCQVTTNGKGLVTSQTPVVISGGGGGNGSGITQLTGDVTTPSGSGSEPSTLATVNSNAGTFGNSTTVPVITVNGKGLVTGVSAVAITGGGGGSGIPAGPFGSISSTCTAGSLYFATDQPAGQQIYTCSSTNVWTQIVNLGGSGALAYIGGSLDIVTSVVPRLTAPNAFINSNSFTGPFFQIGGTSADPSCTQASDIGKIWVNTTSAANTAYEVCLAVSGAFQWVVK